MGVIRVSARSGGIPASEPSNKAIYVLRPHVFGVGRSFRSNQKVKPSGPAGTRIVDDCFRCNRSRISNQSQSCKTSPHPCVKASAQIALVIHPPAGSRIALQLERGTVCEQGL